MRTTKYRYCAQWYYAHYEVPVLCAMVLCALRSTGTVRNGCMRISSVRNGIERFSTVRISTVRISTVHISTVFISTVRISTVHFSTVRISTVHISTVRISTVSVYNCAHILLCALILLHYRLFFRVEYRPNREYR